MSRTCTLALAVVLTGVVGTSHTVLAQTIGGQLKEPRTGQPLTSFPVRLSRIGTADSLAICDSSLTDERGLFQLIGRGAGQYRLEIGKPGSRLATNTQLQALSADTSILKTYVVPLLDLADEGPFAPDEVQVQARLRGRFVLPYPEKLIARRVFDHGEVRARFVVDVSGHVPQKTILIISATRPEFGEAVVDAVSKLTFDPARIGGIAVPQWIQFPTLPFAAVEGPAVGP